MLYFNHIPRTGGTTLSILLKNAFISNKKNVYEKSMPILNKQEISGYDLVIGHMGTYPNTILDNVDSVSIIRNPVDRLLSFYIHGSSWFSKTDQYKDQEKFEENLKFWLFEDQSNNTISNLQSKMISNPVNIELINNLNKKAQSGLIDIGEYVQETQTIIWGVENSNPDINILNKKISELDVIGTTENFDLLKDRLSSFLIDSYGIMLRDNEIHPIIANQSYRYINGKPYTVEILKELLSASEIRKLEEINYLDMGIWENANKLR